MAAVVRPSAFKRVCSSATTACTVCQISLASCSTHPGCGKYCGNSRYDHPTGCPSSSTAKARTPVVPASMATTTPTRANVVEVRDRKHVSPTAKRGYSLLDLHPPEGQRVGGPVPRRRDRCAQWTSTLSPLVCRGCPVRTSG